MRLKIIKILVVLFMLAGLCGSAYFWNEMTKRDDRIAGLNNELDVANTQLRAARKKYTQEKAKLGTCMRMKMAEEAKKLQFQKRVKLLAEEMKVLVAQNEVLVKKLEVAAASLENKDKWIEAYKSKVAKMDERYETLVAKYKEAVVLDRKKTGDIRQLEAQKKEVESELALTQKSLERSIGHNKRLCELSEELVDKYWDKNKDKAEPFTKIGMVELEHLVQEYIKQIDKEQIIEQ